MEYSVENLDLSHEVELHLVVHEVIASQLWTLWSLEVAHAAFLHHSEVLSDPIQVLDA